MSAPSASTPISKARLEAFSDGVFAIVITLLVLELRVHQNFSLDALHRELLAQLPRLGAYVLTFLSVGVFWVAHHLMLGAAERVDRTLLWINLFFLLFVALLLFAAGVLGGYPHAVETVRLYGLNMVCVEVFLIAFWARITRHLLKPSIKPKYVNAGFQRTYAGLGLYAAGAVSAFFVPPWLGVALFWLVPVSYVYVQTVRDRELD